MTYAASGSPCALIPASATKQHPNLIPFLRGVSC